MPRCSQPHARAPSTRSCEDPPLCALRRRIYSNGDSGNVLTIADQDQSAGVVLAQNSNAWASLSDERAKASWRSFGDALARLRALGKVGTYLRVGAATQGALSDRRLVGLSAQEVQAILPEAIVEGGDGLLSLKYQDVFVLGLRAIQELAAEGEAAKDNDAAHDAELAAAKEELASVKAENAALKTKQADQDEKHAEELAAVRMELAALETKQDQKQAAQDELLAALSREVAALRAA